MSSFQKKFYQSLKEWLERNGVAVDTVIGYDDDSWTSVGCDTCGPETEMEVEIRYMIDGHTKTFTYNGSFSEILKELV